MHDSHGQIHWRMKHILDTAAMCTSRTERTVIADNLACRQSIIASHESTVHHSLISSHDCRGNGHHDAIVTHSINQHLLCVHRKSPSTYSCDFELHTEDIPIGILKCSGKKDSSRGPSVPQKLANWIIFCFVFYLLRDMFRFVSYSLATSHSFINSNCVTIAP